MAGEEECNHGAESCLQKVLHWDVLRMFNQEEKGRQHPLCTSSLWPQRPRKPVIAEPQKRWLEGCWSSLPPQSKTNVSSRAAQPRPRAARPEVKQPELQGWAAPCAPACTTHWILKRLDILWTPLHSIFPTSSSLGAVFNIWGAKEELCCMVWSLKDGSERKKKNQDTIKLSTSTKWTAKNQEQFPASSSGIHYVFTAQKISKTFFQMDLFKCIKCVAD